MKKISSVLILMTLVLNMSCLSAQNRNEPPETVVKQFCESLESGDSKRAGAFLTNMPVHVYRKMSETVSKSSNNSSNANSTDENLIPVKKTTPTILTEEELIKKIIPSFLISDKPKLIEIGNVKLKDNESRIRIKLLVENSIYLDYDLFLYKEDNKWKIFDLWPVSSAVRDVYDFYAEP